MKKNIVAALLAPVSMWSIASHAIGLDIPDLGVHIAQLPNATATAQVVRRLDGYLAILPVGRATLTIARVEDPVAPGSDVRDPSFRAAQQAEFYEQLDPKAREQATVISGHDAWTIVSTHSGGRPLVNYRCITYTIVDQHLYRIVSSATGQGKTPPPDFDSAMRVTSELSFAPVARSLLADNTAAAGLLKMPRPKKWRMADWYPLSAGRGGEQGVVDLEYSIDGKGQVRDIQEAYSSSDSLRVAAQAFLRSNTFQVKPNWEADGYQKLRFATEVQFWLNRCPEHHLPRPPGAEVIWICSWR